MSLSDTGELQSAMMLITLLFILHHHHCKSQSKYVSLMKVDIFSGCERAVLEVMKSVQWNKRYLVQSISWFGNIHITEKVAFAVIMKNKCTNKCKYKLSFVKSTCTCTQVHLEVLVLGLKYISKYLDLYSSTFESTWPNSAVYKGWLII